MSSSPRLILFKGLPGVGKSYLSRRLGAYLDIPVISRDDLKTVLKDQGSNTAELGKKSYELMWTIADKQLRERGMSICDTSLVQPTGIPHIEALQKKHAAQVLIIECICSNPELVYDRIRQRSNIPDYYCINSIERYEEFIAQNKEYEHVTFPYPTLKIDTAAKIRIKDLVAQIQSVFDQGKSGQPQLAVEYGKNYGDEPLLATT